MLRHLRLTFLILLVWQFWLAGLFAQNPQNNFQNPTQGVNGPSQNGGPGVNPNPNGNGILANRFSEALSSRRFKAPMYINTKFPIAYYFTGFEPDSAYVLGDGDVYFTYSITKTNLFEFDDNNHKSFFGEKGDPSRFETVDDEYYSVYADIEYTERRASVFYGWGNFLEIGLTNRELIIGNGESLDNLIEVFHNLVGTTEQKREVAGQNNNEFYIYDNRKEKLVFKISDPPNGYLDASWSLSVKWNFFAGPSHAFAFKAKKNINQGGISELNEVEDEEIKSINPSSYNWALHYSYVRPKLDLHLAYSNSVLQQPVLPHLSENISYFSFAANVKTLPYMALNLQLMRFTNFFQATPGNPSLGALIEYSLGMRFYIKDSHQIDFAILENQTQGAKNIDVGFKISYNTYF